MILPAKHLGISESIFGFSAEILSLIHGKKTIDELWENYSKENRRFKYRHSFDNFILSLDFLFTIGAIVVDDRGCINLATH